MSDQINKRRRRFLGTAAAGIGAVELGMTALARADATPPASSPDTGNARVPNARTGRAAGSFPVIKQIDAGALNIGYAEAGPSDGQVVILLHGWPYDIHSYVDVAPMLAAKGYRVIVPHLRGYGTTRFLSADTGRTAQQAAVAADIIALMNALQIRRAVIGGYDWGARTANIIAALWPERCKAMVSVSGYLIGTQALNQAPLAPDAELAWWYQFYFATERGRLGYEKNWHDFARLIWKTASPKWRFDDATFERSAASLANPDHVAITIHNYRWRLGLAEGEPQYDVLEKRLAELPAIGVPTITNGGRGQWRAAPAARRLREEVHGQVPAHRPARRRGP